MPEGDSLHRVAQLLAPKLVGQRLTGLTLVRSAARTEALVGSPIERVEARGKNLLVHFAAGWSLHVHLKMNGRVRIYPRATAPKVPLSATSAVLDTAEHRVMVYTAPIARLLRTRDLIGDLHFRELGPDLLGDSFDLDEACKRLALHGQRPLGEAIMDQSVVAGIGNVWKSELCFNLRLDPFAKVGQFSDGELSGLLSLARTQMYDTVYRAKSVIPDPFAGRGERKARLDRRQGEHVLSVYEREGKACYDCGTIIEMRRQGEQHRSTYYCPQCQPPRSAN
ncbi:MAG TPA: DNA-formamidopyrimidine glycosylase family protein [Polyangiales bacterium]|nr:DNA-formamidopyrimidine glycosylase family protein [Polyangiales bacterium]